MNVSDMNTSAKRLLLGGVAVLGVVALAGCGGDGDGMKDDGIKMDPLTPTQLTLADLKAGASVRAGTYTISGDEAERAAILAALGALDTADIPAAGLSAAGIKLRCAGTDGCGFEIEDGTFTVTGTIEVAATGGTFPSERRASPSGGGGGGGGDDGNGDDGNGDDGNGDDGNGDDGNGDDGNGDDGNGDDGNGDDGNGDDGDGNGGGDGMTDGTGTGDSTPHAVLGTEDLELLATAIDAVSKPALMDADPCGANADCKRLVGELEEKAKAYNLPTLPEFEAESIGEGTLGDLTGARTRLPWVEALDSYFAALSQAIINLEGTPPTYTLEAGTIASAVNAAAASIGSWVSLENKIANDFGGDEWGVWIKDDDASALNYWHREGGIEVTIRNRGTVFGGYDGATATYEGSLDGYAHYTDSQNNDATEGGPFGATVNLTADFDVGDDNSGATITGTVFGFSGTASAANWGDVTLNGDYTAAGGTTAPNAVAGDATGFWSPDNVYDETGTAGTDRRPGRITGRIGLTFTANSDTGAEAGAAAGVFDVTDSTAP